MPTAAERKTSRAEPLWDRVDRNRIKLALFVAAFILGSVFSLDFMLSLPVTVVLLLQTLADPIGFWAEMPRLVPIAMTITLLATAGATFWATFSLLRSEKWLLRRLGAEFVPEGELLDTKYALKDMGIAAGVVPSPALYALETDNVNAFVLAVRHRRAVVGVTRGLVDRLTIDEQRAVFANLVARIVAGDVAYSTGISALVWPVHAWRDRTLRRQRVDFWEEQTDVDLERDAIPSLGLFGLFLFVWGFMLAASLEFIAFGNREANLDLAEKADAEGMLLLKDPAPMLTALEKGVRYDNYIAASGEAFANLFWCWTGPATDDEDDPEWDRVRKLREVLGVEGAGVVTTPDEWQALDIGAHMPPAPPRLEEARDDGGGSR